jgi:hypothetical protein
MIHEYEVFDAYNTKICEILTSKISSELAFEKAKIKKSNSFSVKYKGIKVLERI